MDRSLQTAFVAFKNLCLRLVLQEFGCFTRVQRIAHLLPDQGIPAVYALENVQSSSLGSLCVENIQDQVTVLNAILQFRRQIFEFLAVQLRSTFKFYLEFIVHKTLKGGQSLRPSTTTRRSLLSAAR